MRKSNLWKIFRKLDAKELRELGLFLESPFFNQREDVIQLYEILKRGLGFKEVDLRKEVVFVKIYPNEKYDAKKMGYVMSFLLKQLKQYFVTKFTQGNPVINQTFLCQAIMDKGVDSLFEKEWSNAQKLMSKTATKGGYSHLRRFQLHEMYYEFKRKKVRQGDMHLQEISNELTSFYLIQTLRQRCLMLSHQTVSETEYRQVFFDEVLNILEKGWMEENFLVNIYYHSYKSLVEPNNINHFNTLVELIEKSWEYISKNEIRDIYTLAINYCIKKINKGETSFFDKILKLYKSGLERGVLLEKGVLSRFTYKNISAMGFVANEHEWVLNFLKEYKSFLAFEERDNTYHYNLAIYHFRLSDYEEALKLLRRVEFKRDVFYNLDIRRMLLRIYFELNHITTLLSLLDSFAIYINRHNNLGYHRQNYINLISIVRQILQGDLNQKTKREKLLLKIKTMEALAERQWLLDIINR